MKPIFFALTVVSVLLLVSPQAQGQAWGKESKVLSLGFGASQFFHIDDFNYGPPRPYRRWYWPVTGQINFQGEFGIHDYVGLGFTTGIGGRGGGVYGYTGELNFPIGMIANFHFYQLIADHTEKNIHADKLDIYAGLNLGSGIAATFYRDPNYVNDRIRVAPIVFGGVHAGIRYYFAPKVGVNAEVGFGKSLVNAGFVFKL